MYSPEFPASLVQNLAFPQLDSNAYIRKRKTGQLSTKQKPRFSNNLSAARYASNVWKLMRQNVVRMHLCTFQYATNEIRARYWRVVAREEELKV